MPALEEVRSEETAPHGPGGQQEVLSGPGERGGREGGKGKECPSLTDLVQSSQPPQQDGPGSGVPGWSQGWRAPSEPLPSPPPGTRPASLPRGAPEPSGERG